MIKISVIMPSFLGDYPNAATQRDLKFCRAVSSFLSQTYQDKELIIISDGCSISLELYRRIFSVHSNLVFDILPKQPPFSGTVRNRGLELASGDIVCYLDSDDYFGPQHIEGIAEEFSSQDNPDWIYYGDYVVYTQPDGKLGRCTELEEGKIGTSSIAHRRDIQSRWGDGYGHDFRFIQQLLEEYPTSYRKVLNPKIEYNVCHIPGEIDT